MSARYPLGRMKTSITSSRNKTIHTRLCSDVELQKILANINISQGGGGITCRPAAYVGIEMSEASRESRL